MSPIKVTRVKGNFWDRWDDLFDVPAFLCFIVWGVTFVLGFVLGFILGAAAH